MTISLLHYNPATGLAASLCATGGVSVGGYVNHSWRGAGSCATQGLLTNPWYATYAREWLLQGLSSEEIVTRLKAQDAGYPQRQCLVMDKHGQASALNGEENIEYCGALLLPHIAVAGNMLAGPAVLDALIRSFTHAVCWNADAVINQQRLPDYKPNYELQLADTLIDALESALIAGGDKRGTYSASLRTESFTQAPTDIRVDWSDNSLIDDLRRVHCQVKSTDFQNFLAQLPNQ